MFDLNGNVVSIGTTQLVVKNKVTTSAKKVVLVVGDSLTVEGFHPHEFKRRVTQTDGTPAGDGLSEIKFIGTCEFQNTHYEGYG